MARRKTPTKVEEPAVVEEVKEAPKPKVKKYVSTKAQQWHPFQKVMIPIGSPGAILEMDSWLKCQIEVGLVKEV